MKKKVLIVSNTVGVIYKFKFELLDELLKNEYEVFLFAQNENEGEYIEKIKNLGVKYLEVNISRRGINPIKDLNLIYSYLKNILKIKPDYIYTFTIKPNLYVGTISSIIKIPYISTITGLGTAFQSNKFFLKILKFCYRKALKNAKGIFFENNENLEYFLKNKIILRKQAILVPGSGVNLDRFYPMEKTRIDNKVVYLFIGRIMKEKGIEEFLNAATLLVNKYSEMEFWILGGYEEEKYKKIISFLESKKIIKYLGIKNDVRDIIKECDFIVQPSYHEGLSNVILEGSAMGKIIIASNIPGCREAIYNKKYLFNKKDVKNLAQVIEYSFLNKDSSIEAELQKNYIKKLFDRKKVIEENMKLLESRKK